MFKYILNAFTYLYMYIYMYVCVSVYFLTAPLVQLTNHHHDGGTRGQGSQRQYLCGC